MLNSKTNNKYNNNSNKYHQEVINQLYKIDKVTVIVNNKNKLIIKVMILFHKRTRL